MDTIPPSGGTPSTSYTNSLGEQTSLVQYLSADLTGTQQKTTYSYTPAGKMASMLDSSGNSWTWSYDVLGHQIKAVDPDTGTTTSRSVLASWTYDTVAKGQLSSPPSYTTTYTYNADDEQNQQRVAEHRGHRREA